MDEKIKITDKRMFTAEGELREDYKDERTGEDTRGARPESARVEESPRAESKIAESAAPSSASSEPATKPDRTDPVARAGELPPPTFVDLIGLLAQPIAMFLGDARMPGGETEENLPLARFHIDLLELVQAKTTGNTSPEEAKLLEDLLYQLRLRYVEKAG